MVVNSGKIANDVIMDGLTVTQLLKADEELQMLPAASYTEADLAFVLTHLSGEVIGDKFKLSVDKIKKACALNLLQEVHASGGMALDSFVQKLKD